MTKLGQRIDGYDVIRSRPIKAIPNKRLSGDPLNFTGDVALGIEILIFCETIKPFKGIFKNCISPDVMVI